jgi:carbonic anhydrase
VEKTAGIIEELLAGTRFFREGYHRENSVLYGALGNHGQSPSVMFVSCSDSRYDPDRITCSKPGMLYVLRVTGAIVPPREIYTRNLPIAAALEHGVVHLGVSHIVVCGHSDCGAAKLAANFAQHSGAGATEEGGELSQWIEIISAAPKRASDRIAARGIMEAPVDFAKTCEEELVKISLENLMTYPAIADRAARGALELHGWWFDIASGDICVLNNNSGNFEAA